MYYNVLKNLRLLNVKAKKKMLIIFSCISMIILITCIIAFCIQLYKNYNYEIVSARVTNYNTSDSNNVWTEFSYEYEGNHTVKQKGHSYYMIIGSDIELLVNPSDPSDVEVLRNLFAVPKVIFGVFIICFFFTGIIAIYYFRDKNKENIS